jgi:hypothetical protein
VTLQLRGLWEPVRPYAEFAMEIAAFNDIRVTITSVRRTWAEQTALRARYESCVARGTFGEPGECAYPANRPGDSAHQFGLAFDSWVPEEEWPLWNAIRAYAGFALDASDRVHAEVPHWRNYKPYLESIGITGR